MKRKSTRLLSLLVSFAMIFCFTACGKEKTEKVEMSGSGKDSNTVVVATSAEPTSLDP